MSLVGMSKFDLTKAKDSINLRGKRNTFSNVLVHTHIYNDSSVVSCIKIVLDARSQGNIAV